jgi:hypothetical protein
MNPYNLIFLDFPWMRDKDSHTPLGHASLLATLAQKYSSIGHFLSARVWFPSWRRHFSG